MSHTLVIYDGDGLPAHSFPAPAEKRDARNLWCFLVGNLKSGFLVELAEDEATLRHPSGSKVPVHLYERLMRGDDLDELSQE